MFLVEFTFTRLSVKKGGVLGDLNYPVTTWRLLFVIVTWARGRKSKDLFIQSLRGLKYDPDWLVENEAEILAKKELIHEKLEKSYEKETERLREKNSELNEKVIELNSQMHTLRSAIELVDKP